jgi:hypothetical protein
MQLIVSLEEHLPDFPEHTKLNPLLEAAMAGAAGTELLGHNLPLAAGAQDIKDAV